MQGRRRMIERKVNDVALLSWIAVNPANRLSRKELSHREPSEGNDHFGANRVDLSLQKMSTRPDLIRLRISIVWRPALDDVRNENVAAFQADRRQKLFEKLPSRADERMALLILVKTRRFPNEHNRCIGRAVAGNGLVTGARQRARGTKGDLLGDVLEASHVSSHRILVAKKQLTRQDCTAGPGHCPVRNTYHPSAYFLRPIGTAAGCHVPIVRCRVVR